MEIRIKTIDHSAQAYETCGDWQFHGDVLDISVSDMKNARYEFLVGIHEAIEAMLCREHGIKEEDVTNFDIDFEFERAQGYRTATEEPGDCKDAPYYHQHQIATAIEKKLAKHLYINWNKYSHTVESL